MVLNWNILSEKIDNCLANLKINRQPSTLYNPIHYVLSAGGKRLRPVLLLAGYNMYRDDIEKVFNQAIGIEIYHNYTLVHDDLMDCAELRRGKPVVHKLWNDNTAILSGDSMLVLSIRYIMHGLSGDKLQRVMDLFTRAALEIGEGQQYDIDFETRNNVTQSEYIEMIRLKTSVLLACALQMGAVLADAPDEESEMLYKFAENLGLAFQLQDDYLDVYGNETLFGKKTGGDILCNKKTYLLINALLRAETPQLDELNSWLNKPSGTYQEKEKIQAITNIYNSLHIRELCEQKILEYYNIAIQILHDIPQQNSRKTALKDLSDAMLHRKS